MSDLLIIGATVLCLQAGANAVVIRWEKKAFEQSQPASAGVRSPPLLFFLLPGGILIKYMQMTLPPFEKCKGESFVM